MEWEGETGSHGDQGKERRVPVAGHHWKPPPKVDSIYAKAQVYMVKVRVSLPPGSFWRNERIIEKENREQWEHLSMAYFYFCSQEAISVTTSHPKREPRTESVYHQCSWVHKLVNLLYRKINIFQKYNYFSTWNMNRRLNARDFFLIINLVPIVTLEIPEPRHGI